MSFKEKLTGTKIVFRLIGDHHTESFEGTVREMEDDGFWVEVGSLVTGPGNGLAKRIRKPVVFIPTTSFLYLFAESEE